MLRSLRTRLIFSHVVLLLITIPLVGVALVYMLETRVLLTNLSRQLAGQSVLVAELARDYPEIWSDPAAARAFVARVEPLFPAQLMLLSTDGRVLASSDPADANLVGQTLAVPPLETIARGQPYAQVHYSHDTRAEVADVMAGAIGPDGQVAGLIRLTDQFAGVLEQFLRLRYLIAEVLAVGLLLGSVAGLFLAVNVERPLRRVTEAVESLTLGRQLTALPEQGPEETRVLLRAVNTLVARLRGVEETRRQLLSNVVHELGRPLGALAAAVHALRSGASTNAALREDLLLGIDGELRRLERLVNDLAELQDKLSGTLRLQRETVDLADWLSAVLAPWAEAAQQKGLVWAVTVAPDLPCLSIDPDRLGQALGNLLSNAVKYTSAGGRIAVAAHLEQGSLCVTVADSGPGIPTAEQEHIFEPFYRSPANGLFPQGMGLGLSIARDLVQAHGGRLSLESTPNAGSHFTIALPL
jgi:two-component system, OmpR family, sensor histidine kinase BaeS